MIEDDLSASPVKLRAELRRLRALLPPDFESRVFVPHEYFVGALGQYLCPLPPTCGCACPGTCRQRAEHIATELLQEGLAVVRVRSPRMFIAKGDETSISDERFELILTDARNTIMEGCSLSHMWHVSRLNHLWTAEQTKRYRDLVRKLRQDDRCMLRRSSGDYLHDAGPTHFWADRNSARPLTRQRARQLRAALQILNPGETYEIVGMECDVVG